MPIDPRPVDVGGIVGALAQLGQSNALVAERDRQERDRRRARRERLLGTVGAVVGGTIGLAGGPGGAIAGMNIGQQLGRGVGGGEIDPVALTSGALSGYQVYQGQQAAAQRARAAEAVRSALSPPPVVDETGRETAGVLNPQRLMGALAIDPSLLPTAVQTGLAFHGQEAQERAAAADRALRMREQDITVKGQERAESTAAAGRELERELAGKRISSEEEIAKAQNEAAEMRAIQQRTFQMELEKFKLEYQGKEPNEIVGRIMQKAINGEPITEPEKQSIELWKKGNPFARELAGDSKLTSIFNPKGTSAPAAPKVTQEQATANAKAAIAAGKDEDAVRAKFKKDWGVDLQ